MKTLDKHTMPPIGPLWFACLATGNDWATAIAARFHTDCPTLGLKEFQECRRQHAITRQGIPLWSGSWTYISMSGPMKGQHTRVELDHGRVVAFSCQPG